MVLEPRVVTQIRRAGLGEAVVKSETSVRISEILPGHLARCVVQSKHHPGPNLGEADRARKAPAPRVSAPWRARSNIACAGRR
jgi:hypothetical protein